MFGLFFTDVPVVDSFEAAMTTNVQQFQNFYHHMLQQGIYFGPSAYEAAFVSQAHDHAILDETLKAAHTSFEYLNKNTN